MRAMSFTKKQYNIDNIERGEYTSMKVVSVSTKWTRVRRNNAWQT